MLVNKVLVFYILGLYLFGSGGNFMMTMVTHGRGGIGFIGYIQDPLRGCRSPDLFPALFDT